MRKEKKMRSILGRHKLRAVAAAAAGLTLLATPSAGTTQNAGTTHGHDAHVHSSDAGATAASAEPDHTATLDRSDPKFTWEGSGSGVPDPSAPLFGPAAALFRCTGALFSCEYILLHVEKAGELTLTLDNTDAVDPSDPSCVESECSLVHDIDGRLYRSNAAGELLGNTLTKDCVTGSSSETCKVAAWPGFYMVEVEYGKALDAHYIGTVELDVDAPLPSAEPQLIPLEGCNFTLYYFKDSAERMQTFVPPGYRLRPAYGDFAGFIEGSATIAAAAFDCDRIEVPGSSPASGIFTVLSVLVEPPDQPYNFQEPPQSDFYVLGIHANNSRLVKLLASRGMPAYLVPGMTFEKPLQSLALRVEVPWSSGPYELATSGVGPGLFHTHDNSYWHDAGNPRSCPGEGANVHRPGCVVRMDFQTHMVRDQGCLFDSDDHHTGLECGKLTTEEGTPVADFFGGSDRNADLAWDHDPIEHSWLVLE
jgi:hypothetical protein